MFTFPPSFALLFVKLFSWFIFIYNIYTYTYHCIHTERTKTDLLNYAYFRDILMF